MCCTLLDDMCTIDLFVIIYVVEIHNINKMHDDVMI